jgi:outer membrane protein assembly factor BamB
MTNISQCLSLHESLLSDSKAIQMNSPRICKQIRGMMLALLIPLLLAGCSVLPEWWGAESETKLEGNRIAILPEREILAADSSIQTREVTIPAARNNGAWYQEQAVAEDGISIVRHLALKSDLSHDKTFTDASAPTEDVRITSNPVVVGDIIALLDGQGMLTARKTSAIDDIIWSADLKKMSRQSRSASGREVTWMTLAGKKDDFLGGNISFVEGYIVATTGNGNVFAFDIASGAKLWQRSMGIAIQSAPSGRNGTVYFVTADNQLYALSLKDGKTIWSHNGIPQQTKILGAPAPVPLSELVIVPYSSGELVALKQSNGFKLWEENLATNARSGALGFRFSDILAAPVAFAGRVFVSAEGQLITLDVMTGNRLWSAPITLSSTPWVGGEWLFGITNQSELVAIHTGDGKIRWVTPLPQFADNDKKKDRIRWSGPVLASEKLIVTGSKGELKTFNFSNGEPLATRDVIANIELPPVIANGTLYLLNNAADLEVIE